jgi:DNA-binding winged helix-turn-helix (wHTH) protein
VASQGERRETYQIADLKVDVGSMIVSRSGLDLQLPPLSFEMLLHLVRRAPDVVSHDELLGSVWQGVVVAPDTVKQRVKLLRESLHDDPRKPRYIATVRCRGYRLIPPAVPGQGGWVGGLSSRLRRIIGTSTEIGRKRSLLAAFVLLSLLGSDAVNPDSVSVEATAMTVTMTADSGRSSVNMDVPGSDAFPFVQPACSGD